MKTLRRQWILILFQVKYKTTKSTYCVIYLQPDVSTFVYTKCTAFTLRSLIVFIRYLTKCFQQREQTQMIMTTLMQKDVEQVKVRSRKVNL